MQAGSGLIIQQHPSFPFFYSEVFLNIGLTCSVDSHALTLPRTHSRPRREDVTQTHTRTHTLTLTSPHRFPGQKETGHTTFHVLRFYLANYSPIFFSNFFSFLVLFFFFFNSCSPFFLIFIYNSKNKSFSSRFYIRHLQVQCVTCPSYKVHLYRHRSFHNMRGELKRKQT